MVVKHFLDVSEMFCVVAGVLLQYELARVFRVVAKALLGGF